MSEARRVVYEFGRFVLAPAEKRLLRDGKVVSLTPKAFDTLVLLVGNQGRLIEKDELLKTLWPHRVVEEVALAHNVSQLRKALGDTAEAPRFIETVPKRGYRFVAAVQERYEQQEAPLAVGVESGKPVSTVWHYLPSRAAVVAAFAAVLLLASGTAAYFYLSPTAEPVEGVPPAIHSLAVLPFENLSGDKEQQYFADGMTDELITELGTIGSLRVVSRTSAMRYKGTHKPLRDIADELQVDAVVEGTILRSGHRVRINAQLIAATSDRHLWAQSYERDLRDVLALQDHVSRDIAAIIGVKLTLQQRAVLSGGRAIDPEAHDDYLRGRAVNPEAHDDYLRGRYWSSGIPTERFASGDDLRRGLDYFRKAIAIDPDYAPAYAGVADAYRSLAGGSLTFKEALPKARAAAVKALQLDPSLAEAHQALAGVNLYLGDWPGAEREFRQALALNPNYALAHEGYAAYLASMGKLDEAVKQDERAVDLDPFSIDANANLGITLYLARRYDDAMRQFQRGLEMHPNLGLWNFFMAYVFEQKKRFAEAYAQYHRSLVLNRQTLRAEAAERAYKRSGYTGALQQMIQFLLPPNSSDEELNIPLIVHRYAMLGDDAHAMLWLERAAQERQPKMSWWLNDPALDRLRASPRFGDLVRRMGLPTAGRSGKRPMPESGR
ncbi:winged helix-turn-helix domain-containing tetratricopeptide repeat protein [Frateuria terrea]|uniref:TolB amino-terminal domain-containing protein n=1 Tax=Frateuria terrea TaxID=529704 RepID=A0A1H6QNJ7_9GAMM|nr:winged helix-turn-helix domain-containing protein [Frateuria terrea]SEI45169.1 TolB amino-terminal domain-containing protein [Frateuria terrea]SFP10898.1 TolB amino-terminal domain-containing protein [Frateuria terrea]